MITQITGNDADRTVTIRWQSGAEETYEARLEVAMKNSVLWIGSNGNTYNLNERIPIPIDINGETVTSTIDAFNRLRMFVGSGIASGSGGGDSLANLIAGNNITITPNGDGTFTIDAANVELFVIVASLPAVADADTNKLYLVPASDPDTDDVFDEWYVVNGAWERAGALRIDLSNYYTKTETDDLLTAEQTAREDADVAKLDKQTNANTLYAVDNSGTQFMQPYLKTPVPNAIPQRQEQGHLYVPEAPTSNNHAASKKYVDDTAGTLQTQVTDISNRQDAMIGKVHHLKAFDFGTADEPDLQTLMTVYAQTELERTDIPNSVSVQNLFDKHEWIYNEDDGRWIDNGITAVSEATNNQPGIVKGSDDEFKVGIDPATKKMIVNGLPEKMEEIDDELSQVSAIRVVNFHESAIDSIITLPASSFTPVAGEIKIGAFCFDYMGSVGVLINMDDPASYQIRVVAKTPRIPGIKFSNVPLNPEQGGETAIPYNSTSTLWGNEAKGSLIVDIHSTLGVITTTGMPFGDNPTRVITLTSRHAASDFSAGNYADAKAGVDILLGSQNVFYRAEVNLDIGGTTLPLYKGEFSFLKQPGNPINATYTRSRTYFVNDGNLTKVTFYIDADSKCHIWIPRTVGASTHTRAYGRVYAYSTGDDPVAVAVPVVTFPAAAPTFDPGNPDSALQYDINEEQVWQRVGTGVVSIPNYSAMETTNRISTNGGEWTADRNGFVRVSIQATGPASALASINGKQVGQSYSGTGADKAAFVKDIFAVKAGDVVKLFTDGGTASNINCFYTPPVYIPTNLSGLINYPNQWPANTEIDLGNGLYGKRITGTITAAVDERAAVSIQTGVSNVISYGGTWGTRDADGGAMSPVGGLLTQSSGTASQGFISEIRLDSVGYMGFYSTSNQPRSGGANTRYDVWVKYTK